MIFDARIETSHETCWLSSLEWGENIKIDNKTTAFNLFACFAFARSPLHTNTQSRLGWSVGCCLRFALLAANICAIIAWHIRAISQHIRCPPTVCVRAKLRARLAFDRSRKRAHRIPCCNVRTNLFDRVISAVANNNNHFFIVFRRRFTAVKWW